MSHTMQVGTRHLQRERGRRLAEALSILAEPVPGLPADSEEANIGLPLLDMRRVAPQS